MPRRAVSPLLRANARRLRREMTGAEGRLWSLLRGHRFVGVSFRRQTPIGPWVVDFLCASARLVIEVDGGQHCEPEGVARDRRRTEWLEAAGYRVLRFWNHEVLAETDAVLEVIFVALRDAGSVAGDQPPLPVPPPPGGRAPEGPRPSHVATAEFGPREVSAVVVPSPLEGEGQGGGAPASAKAETPDTHRSSASKIGPIP